MSTTAMAADTNQLNFNPSWMRPVSVAPTVGSTGAVCGRQETQQQPAGITDLSGDEYPIADPIFAKHRYGREDLLALLSKDVTPPDGLNDCLFFVSTSQRPIVLISLSDIETRLQHNINSSKAMNLLSHADRVTIASGGVIGATNLPSQVRNVQDSRSFSPSWMPQSGAGRGNVQSGRLSSFVLPYRGRGVTSSGSGSGSSDPPTIGRYSSSVRGGRGGVSNLGRGGAHTVTPFNSRAQGLYDPRDPRDRPRQRMRSTSDDTSNLLTLASDESMKGVMTGWTQVGRGMSSWKKREHTSSIHRHSGSDIGGPPGRLPEWMNDGEDREEKPSIDETGTFDDRGQFRTVNAPRMLSQAESEVVQSITDGKFREQSERSLHHDQQQQQKNDRQSTQIATKSLPTPVSTVWSSANENSDVGLILPHEQVTSISMATGTYHSKFTNELPLLHHSLPQPAASLGINSANEVIDDWLYIDPKNAVQGPFTATQMQAWYKLGYFTLELRVRSGRSTDSGFITLAELIQANGSDTPFKLSSSLPTSIQLPLQQQQDLGPNIWGRDFNASLIEAVRVKEEREMLEKEQRRVAEQERQLKEMRDILLKEEEERAERERKILEKERQLQKAQEELTLLAVKEKERAAAREHEMEMERKRLAEELERAKKEEKERVIAENKLKEQERNAQRLITENLRRKLLEEIEERESTIKKEVPKETEENPKTASEVDFHTVRGARRKDLSRASKNIMTNVHTKSDSASKKEVDFVVTEEFAAASKQKVVSSPSTYQQPFSWQAVYRSGEEKLEGTRTVPWVLPREVEARSCEPSLVNIQREEEREMLAKTKEKSTSEVHGAASDTNRASVWSSASQKLTWRQNSQPSSTEQHNMMTRRIAWGGAGVPSDSRSFSSELWDSTLLGSANKSVKAESKSMSQLFRKDNGLNQSIAAKTKPYTEHEAMKNLFKQSASKSPLINWVVQRVKQLNSEVDADVFAVFIEGVDNPNEVEDYIIGYLGESRAVKDFVQAFLERRCEARQKKEPLDKDDLSHSAAAADTLSATPVGVVTNSAPAQQGISGGGRKKKKWNKGNKLLVDGTCLGFKATADSNRVNVGEIDTVNAAANFPYK